MNGAVILACLALISVTHGTTVGQHSSTGGFCYRDADGCGPGTSEWAPLCHSGKRQSPISLPPITLPLGSTPLKYSVYRGDYFRMQNNGHSVQIDFDNQGPSNQQLAFPDPLSIYGPYTTTQNQRQYKFAAAHFHWGVSDFSTGSEHCIGIKCAAMELHLVHYLASYPNMAAAVASGNENALTVIGVLIDVNALKTVGGGILNAIVGQSATTAGTGSLKPIVDNLHKIAHADHDTTKWTVIRTPLDLSKLLFEAGAYVYSYKGSLTTPGCNEQVNWFVLKNPASTSHQDLETFRSVLKDSRSQTLNENHRPLQALNGRKVLLSTVIPY